MPRVYSNFCSIQNSPFDFTLTFCEMLPIGEREIQEAQSTHLVKAPVRARMVVPVQMIPGPDRRPAGELPALPGVVRAAQRPAALSFGPAADLAGAPPAPTLKL